MDIFPIPHSTWFYIKMTTSCVRMEWKTYGIGIAEEQQFNVVMRRSGFVRCIEQEQLLYSLKLDFCRQL